MRLIKLYVLLAGCLLTASACAVPAVLIVRIKPPKGVAAYDSPICDLIANELQAGGRTVPIVWGLGDPIYRAAIQEGKIRSGNETPTLSEALSVAAKLKAEYVMVTDVRLGEGEILSAAFLYKSGKLVWKDPDLDVGPQLAHLRDQLKKKQITQDEYNDALLKANYRRSAIQISSHFGPDDTLRSIARTWSEMESTGPFAALPKQVEKQTPDPGRGESPRNPGTDTTPPVKIADDKTWLADATAAIKGGDSSKAVSLLRDAVDAAPLDPARRIYLIKTLINIGQPEVAAKEARRAAELMADHIEFRALAARAWIQAGNTTEAQSDLNEAVTRAPDSPDTRLLLAEVAIASGNFPAAIDHLNKAISVTPTGDEFYLRGIAHAMAGDLDLAGADISKASATGLSTDAQESEARSALVASLFDAGLQSIGAEIRTLHSRAQVQRTDKDVLTTFADLQKRVNGRAKFISDLPIPVGHELSHNRRVLAYKLLSQSLSDLESFLKSGDGDVLTDSRINLGEALKQGATARERFRTEQQGMKKSDGKPG